MSHTGHWLSTFFYIPYLFKKLSKSQWSDMSFLPLYDHFEIRRSLGRKWHHQLKPRLIKSLKNLKNITDWLTESLTRIQDMPGPSKSRVLFYFNGLHTGIKHCSDTTCNWGISLCNAWQRRRWTIGSWWSQWSSWWWQWRRPGRAWHKRRWTPGRWL